jgi:hypothetical protein
MLVLGPGKVISYERNALTNARLEAAGHEVIRVAGGELAGCRGGPRAICCPVGREPAAMVEAAIGVPGRHVPQARRPDASMPGAAVPAAGPPVPEPAAEGGERERAA